MCVWLRGENLKKTKKKNKSFEWISDMTEMIEEMVESWLKKNRGKRKWCQYPPFLFYTYFWMPFSLPHCWVICYKFISILIHVLSVSYLFFIIWFLLEKHDFESWKFVLIWISVRFFHDFCLNIDRINFPGLINEIKSYFASMKVYFKCYCERWL